MKKEKEFKILVGIDQTGAVDPRGRPRPLQVTVVDCRKNTRVHPKLKLEKLCLPFLTDLLEKNIGNFENQPVLICVDSVLGLPQALRVGPRSILKKIKNFSFEGKQFGALTAYSFFRQFLRTENIPHRKVELQVKANSVFNLKPFQKNIGCGSYRILKDLSEDTSWFSLWPFEKQEAQFIIAEGYPSFYWRTLFGQKKRDLKFLNKKYPKYNLKNLDQADSLLLALGALHFQEQIFQFKKNNRSAKEGWILGVPHE